MKPTYCIIYTCVCLLLCVTANAQEESNAVYHAGKRYVSLNIKSQNKFANKVQKQQDKLLKKLCKQEKRLANKLKRNDSAGYARYLQQPLTFDSLNTISKNRSTSPIKASNRVNGTVDSLKNITRFISDKIHLQGGSNELGGYSSQLSSLNTQLNTNAQLDNMIGQRASFLKGLNPQSSTGIDKNVYYAREKIKVFRSISEEPDKAEEAALEILQGQAGFEEALQGDNANSLQTLAGKGASTSDLEKMGYKTKRQMQQLLQSKFGSNLGGLQEGMSKQITDYQDKLKELENAKKTFKNTKQSAQQLKHIDKPSFKVNPMRGLPFGRRIEKQYNWQTSRATIDGKPAMFQFSAIAGFKHTPRLSYGGGLATSIGLGKNWNNIRFTFEGLGLRTYAQYKVIWGIGAYAGYERMFKRVVFTGKDANTIEYNKKENQHNTRQYSEAVMLGVTKDYRINEKWNGSLQVLYDVWWKEKGLNSPIQIRITTLKN